MRTESLAHSAVALLLAGPLVAALLLGPLGCAADESDQPQGTPRDLFEPGVGTGSEDGSVGESAVLTGTLRGGMMAIGGETTGWQIELPDGQHLEADVSAVDNPEQYDGRQVRAAGRFAERDYVERGPTPVFVVESIEPGPPGPPGPQSGPR